MKDQYHTEHGECVIDLMPIPNYGENWWLMTGCQTYWKYRGRGYASHLMRQVIKDADEEGARIALQADAQPHDNRKKPGLNQMQLMAFYRRYGFRSGSGDDERMMVR